MAIAKTTTPKGPQYKITDSRNNTILVVPTLGPVRSIAITAADGVSGATILPEHSTDLVQLLLQLNQGVAP